MELIELARGTWSDALRALSRECAGGAAHIRSSGAAGSLRPTSPLNRSLQELRYDEVRREVEVSIALDRGAWPRLRCFVAEPDHIFVGRSTDGRALVVLDRNGSRTLVHLAAASDTRGNAGGFADEDDTGPEAIAGAGV